MQHDDELWEELIKLCLHKAEMVSTEALPLLSTFPYPDLLKGLKRVCPLLLSGWHVIGAHSWQSRSSLYCQHGS